MRRRTDPDPPDPRVQEYLDENDRTIEVLRTLLSRKQEMKQPRSKEPPSAPLR